MLNTSHFISDRTVDRSSDCRNHTVCERAEELCSARITDSVNSIAHLKLIGNGNLDPDKVELVPEDGSLFLVTDVVFFEGESVFNVLQRTMKQNKQHLEFVQTPLYNSAYIEGICNLYAYDAGDLSGWMYSVNGAFPNYGCSQYVVQAGDVIVWHYTCDLGADLGAENASGNNQ